MKTWNWLIDYTIQRADGSYREKETTVVASTLPAAYTTACNLIVEEHPDILRYKIWNVGIIVDSSDPEEVF